MPGITRDSFESGGVLYFIFFFKFSSPEVNSHGAMMLLTLKQPRSILLIGPFTSSNCELTAG